MLLFFHISSCIAAYLLLYSVMCVKIGICKD